MNNTNYLFVEPSFLNGIARSIDLFGVFTEYNTSPTPQETDPIALYSGVQAIRQDYKKAFAILEEHCKSR